MADQKISQLTPDTNPSYLDLLALVDQANLVTKKVAIQDIQHTINVRQYGALGDGKSVVDAAITSGSNVLTSGSGLFTAADVGKRIVVEGAGGGGATLPTTILSFNSASSVNIATNASTTISNGFATWGTDDTTAIKNAITAAALGFEVFFPTGLYLVTSTIIADGPVLLKGTGLDYAGRVDVPITKGSVIICAATMTDVVRLGTDPSPFNTGRTGASMEHMSVDGMNLATNAVSTLGRRNYIEFCQIQRGLSIACNMTGQNGYLQFSIIGQKDRGYVVSMSGGDNKVFLNQIRQGGNAQIEVYGNNGVMIQNNHIFASYNNANNANVLIHNMINNAGNIMITDNQFDTTLGHEILISQNSNSLVKAIVITGNDFYQQSGFPNNTYSIVKLQTADSSGTIRGVTISGNTCDNQLFGNSNNNFKAIVEASGGGVFDAISVTGNTGVGVSAVNSGFRPDKNLGNVIQTTTATGSNRMSDNGGATTFDGDGSTTTFSIPHLLAGTPNNAVITPGSAAAAGDHYVTYDATNIVVHFSSAPASGLANVALNWQAFL